MVIFSEITTNYSEMTFEGLKQAPSLISETLSNNGYLAYSFVFSLKLITKSYRIETCKYKYDAI